MLTGYMIGGLVLTGLQVKKKQLYGPFSWMGFNCLKATATSRRQFTFYHSVPNIYMIFEVDGKICQKIKPPTPTHIPYSVQLSTWGRLED